LLAAARLRCRRAVLAQRPRLPPCRGSPCSLAGRQLGCAAAKDQPCSPYPTS
jgi:hypothetical protein